MLESRIGRRQFLAALFLTCSSVAAAEGEKLSVTFAYNAVISEQLLLIDIRTPNEWRRTGIPVGAYGIDMDSKEFYPELRALAEQYPNRKIALISTTGGRSAYLARYLARQGVLVYDVPGGIVGKSTSWKSKNLPFYKYRSPL